MPTKIFALKIALLILVLVGCDELVSVNDESQFEAPPPTVVNTPIPFDDVEMGRVVRVVDGDTIEVELNGRVVDVRYVGVNTPERDEVCYSEATQANADRVAGQTVRLVQDVSDTDRFDRLLRYIYVGDTFVNRELIVGGYAEAVLYEPDDRYFDEFSQLEQQAARSDRGCHPTGIFDDNNRER